MRKKRGSLTIDMTMSLGILAVLVMAVTLSLSNFLAIEAKNEETHQLIEILSEESDKENIYLENSNLILDNMDKIIQYRQKGADIQVERRILNKDFGMIESKISVKKGDLSDEAIVYSIINYRGVQ